MLKEHLKPLLLDAVCQENILLLRKCFAFLTFLSHLCLLIRNCSVCWGWGYFRKAPNSILCKKCHDGTYSLQVIYGYVHICIQVNYLLMHQYEIAVQCIHM